MGKIKRKYERQGEKEVSNIFLSLQRTGQDVRVVKALHTKYDPSLPGQSPTIRPVVFSMGKKLHLLAHLDNKGDSFAANVSMMINLIFLIIQGLNVEVWHPTLISRKALFFFNSLQKRLFHFSQVWHPTLISRKALFFLLHYRRDFFIPHQNLSHEKQDTRILTRH